MEQSSSARTPEDLVRLKDRALSATAEGITIADARLPDRPLIYVNEGFERLTGYPREHVLGKNCRFLQGAGTDAETITAIREAIAGARACTVEILNYRKDGTPFWNRLSITPVTDDAGDVTHFIGVQSDVSERRRAEEELRRAKSKLESALGELQRDLDLAARVQQSFLPQSSPRIEGVDIAWAYRPCAQLAGDFLNVFALDDDRVAFYVLDVSGHGASSALLSVTLSRLLTDTPSESCLFQAGEDRSHRIARPREVAAFLNEQFQLDTRIAQYFTLIYGILDVPARRFDYVAAGHPGPVHVPADGATRAHSSTSTPIGLLPNAEFEEASLSLATGDRIYLYTDGVTEAVNHRDEELGEERFTRSLEASRGEPLEAALERVLGELSEWRGRQPAKDDVTLLGAQVP